MNQDTPSVELRSVRKQFGDFVALRDINLEIQNGEFFSVLGPSGCGKSTILRLIAGLEDIDSGALLIDGNDMVSTPGLQASVQHGVPELRDLSTSERSR